MNLFNRIFNLDERCSLTSSGKEVDSSHHHQHHANKLRDEHLSQLVIQLTNCRLIRADKLINEDLWMRDGKILDPEKVFFDEKLIADLQIDCDGLIIAPGFIDTQLNGGFGHDFTNPTANDINSSLDFVSARLLKYGVTAYCPTLISSDASVYARLLPQIKPNYAKNAAPIGENINGAYVLGVHLEGPFINKDKLGCHDVAALKAFPNGIESLEQVYGSSVGELKKNVSIITLAPELDPSGEVVRAVTASGMIVSLGHSSADLAQGERACASGARFITHLFNAMMPFHHRDPHLIGLLSNRNLVGHENIYYGIIADGIHTHPAAINIAYKSHPSGLVLVTDSIAAMGLDEGVVHIGKQQVEIVTDPANKRLRSAYLQGTKTLSGSVATMDECVINLMSATGCSIVEAAKCASEHPAKMLGLYPSKGSLCFGADADFVFIDEAVNVKATFINGDLVWSSPEWSPLFKCKFIP